ncbi:DUF1304 domain-containing protein [Demequina flava]|uniref:DUF1304 domain-containing protein n=1 Tax=Demequina flava TaxID=1095025 RepID=UPI000782FD74|nr:DUF1304 domain-containing protein [Demequina flava]
MLIAAQILAALAALLHVYIFWMESFAWEQASTRAVFGTGSVENARATKDLAYNQGFYNLFLALITLVGLALMWAGQDAPGAALIFAGAGSMLAAAIVLTISGKKYRGAAIKQGTLPALAIICLALALI